VTTPVAPGCDQETVHGEGRKAGHHVRDGTVGQQQAQRCVGPALQQLYYCSEFRRPQILAVLTGGTAADGTAAQRKCDLLAELAHLVLSALFESDGDAEVIPVTAAGLSQSGINAFPVR
jgi:hypothetical protein